jgi:transcriptional regulator with GAF, ATPase, and Fis domain
MGWLSLRFGAEDGVRSDRLGGPSAFLKRAHTLLERQALMTEVELTHRVGHPAYRRVRAVAIEGDAMRVAFEAVDGVPWIEHAAAHPEQLVRQTIALLRALRSLHRLGVAHGDLKPEHVLIASDGALRLIDLGLASAFGAPVRGGTHGYLAPELLAGEPVQVASDLYALGRTLAEIPGVGSHPMLGDLAERCAASDPRARPSSTGAVLLALGALGEEDPVPPSLPTEVRDALDGLGRGAVLIIEVPRDAGREALALGIARRFAERGALLRALPATALGGPLLHVAEALGHRLDTPLEASVRAARQIASAAPLLHEDADRLDEDGRSALLAAARALVDDAMLVMGPDDTLAAALDALGASRVKIVPLDDDAIRRALGGWGAPHDPATVRAARRVTGGHAGAIAELARAMGDTPERSVADVWAELRGRGALIDPGAAAHDETPEARRERARALLDRGAPRGARALLICASSLEDLVLRADAERRAGLLSDALTTLELARLDPASKAEHEGLTIASARLLERLGRHAEARALAEPLASAASGRPRAEASSVAAQCALVMGAPAEAERLAASGIAALIEDDGEDDAVHHTIAARLFATRSDAALRSHDPERALALAAEARTHAQRTGAPLMMAHAIARSAAALALSGDPRRARSEWQTALSHAEASGDVAALPPYVMNLATADHALLELSLAMAGYERAAKLATRLGRTSSRAAALCNLGGLLTTIGAEAEARAVLADAERDAAELPLQRAQCRLFCAELTMRRDPAAARAQIAEVHAAFVRCGAERQALEAMLCGAEIELAAGAPRDALACLLPLRSSLAAAGLQARGALLAARARLSLGELEEARGEADRALTIADAAGDGDLLAQALHASAQIHDTLGTGASAGLASRARTALGELAARVPPGLRDAFLAHPARRGITEQRATATRVSERGLGESSRRLLALVSRLLVEDDEQRLLETALDEAVALTRAERAFLLLKREGRGRPEVGAARNLDRETIQRSRFRWSRSVAEQVLETGEPLVTASATDDPALRGSRSVLDLGLRSILSVPVRARSGVIGALYLDHRFETGRFGDEDRELVQALADVIGLALMNGRLLNHARAQKHEIQRLYDAVQKESARKDAELSRLSHKLETQGASDAPEEVSGIVGSSGSLRRVLSVAHKVAPSDLGVLIEGESGTGKELLARFLHDHSLRAAAPWFALNCGALPESILESELFGHQRGAFTGAVRDHLGVFRAADGGTVFLDEVGELPAGAQARLLRVLQEREVQPLGANRAVKVDVRVIAATNRTLSDEVEAGRFRRDLYFRLVGATLTLPPLRERREDLPAIARALLQRIAHEPGMRATALSPRALAAVMAHPWPGNIRELHQTLRRAVVVSDGATIGPEDLGLAAGERPRERKGAREALERDLIEDALRRAGGNRTVAAKALGISRVTLHRLSKRLAIDVPAKMGRPRS